MLHYEERRSQDHAQGLLVLHHGRGTSEQDLLPLADVLDPERRLHVVAPRAPLQLPGAPGYHWYRVPQVGFPDPQTFFAARDALAQLHDALWERTGMTSAQTVLGGFSMGTVMSYALALDRNRPQPAGILGFSGFIPTVDGWEPELSPRNAERVFIAHGRNDPVIGVAFARQARELLEQAGFEIDYRESEATHSIDPRDIPRAVEWLRGTLG
jgi:phospholipase/carboxylesterase